MNHSKYIPQNNLLKALALVAFLASCSDEPEANTQKFNVRCLDDNGLLYSFVKTRDEWWRTSHGTLVVVDGGKRHSFKKGKCTYKPV